MQKTVLLHEVVARLNFDVHLAWIDAQQPGTERGHEVLTRKAVANPRFERGILRDMRNGRRHAESRRQSTQIGAVPKSAMSRRIHDP